MLFLSGLPRSPRSVLLAADSLDPGNGGICRVARLIARVLEQEIAAGRLSHASAVVLGDEKAAAYERFPVYTARSRRAAYVARIWAGMRSHTHIIYDSVSMARAHPPRFWPLWRRPQMIYLHGLEVWEIARPDHLAAARRGDVLIANSHYTKERASRLHAGLDRAGVCWLATEEDEPADRAPPPGSPTVTIIGRVEAYKGHEQLIECWPRIVAAVPDARLLVVGRGPCLARFQSLAAASPVRDNIEFAGYVPEDQMPRVWARTHVFAMPSRGEGFGLVYIEAMRHAVPCIASVHDAAQEINIDGQTGFNVSMDAPGPLEERIIYLLRNPDNARRMGENGRRRWAEHFTCAAFSRRFTPHLRQFLEL